MTSLKIDMRNPVLVLWSNESSPYKTVLGVLFKTLYQAY